MLDRSHFGTVGKIANEAPVPVFKCTKGITETLGGCGNVAANLAAMGCEKLFLFSRVGCDSGWSGVDDADTVVRQGGRWREPIRGETHHSS